MSRMLLNPGIERLKNADTPYIIAEVGSNWKNLTDCLFSISLAKSSGADAVKFQLYSHEEMYGYPGEMKGVLPPEWVPKLAEKARTVGIDFMCTPFSVEGAKLIDPYVKMHKVASSDLTFWPMLDFLRSTGKPILLSTGGLWHPSEIEWAVSFCNNNNTENNTVVMHCVSAYPARKSALFRLMSLSSSYPDSVLGYSDHTTDVFDIPRMSVEMGARVIEKHVNFVGGDNFPDSPHSLSTEEFHQMTSYLKSDRIPESYWAGREQMEMRLRHNRRLVATAPIKPGDQLILGQNVGFYRSKDNDCLGSNCLQVDPLVVVKADRNYEVGDGVNYNTSV